MSETLEQATARLRFVLKEAGNADAARDVRMLIGGVLGLDATAFISGGERPLSGAEITAIEDAVRRRAAREPVHRILGRRGFFGLMLELSSATLEPRPDTEILVESLIPIAEAIVARKGTCRLLDLGTGTGAIALALVKEVAGLVAVGTDLSAEALATAARNAEANGLGDRFRTRQGDWFSATPDRFDIVVSNPPYIVSAVIDELDIEVRDHDPLLALDGGADGLDAYRAIIDGAEAHLEEDGWLAFEIGYDQKAAVTAIAHGHGFLSAGSTQDLSGNDRVLLFRRPRSGEFAASAQVLFAVAKKRLGIVGEAG